MADRLAALLAGFEEHRPLERAATIPASWYHDPDLAELERKVLFGNTWQFVARAEQLVRPGSFVTCDLAGEPLLFVRGDDGVLRGFYNVCRHRGARVACTDHGQATRLRCRYHGWTYDLAGRLRGTPEFDGVAEFAKEDNGLPPITVAEQGPFVFAHLGANPGSLEHWLGPILRRGFEPKMAPLTFAGRKEYRLRCNWKVFVDNYLDGGYHVNTVHPALASVIDYAKYRNEIDEHASVQISPLEQGADASVNSVRTGDCAYYAWIFPNLMINLYEGVMDTNLVLPDGPGACRVIFEFWFGPSNRSAEEEQAYREQSMAVADRVQMEDAEVCEEVQRGLASRSYTTGRFSVRREAPGYHFHQVLARHLRRGFEEDRI